MEIRSGEYKVFEDVLTPTQLKRLNQLAVTGKHYWDGRLAAARAMSIGWCIKNNLYFFEAEAKFAADLVSQLGISLVTAYISYQQFIVNLSGSAFGMPWHQDLAYDPESASGEYITLWFALQDVTPENGGFQFLPATSGRKLLKHTTDKHGFLQSGDFAHPL